MARILVLQEMEQNIINIREAMSERGHDLVFVRDQVKALELLQQQPFDLIISAVYLEQSDVFDFARAVRRQPDLHHLLPFVFYCCAISTFARSVRGGLRIAAASTGVDLYVAMEKFNPRLFAQQIEECLRKKQLEAGNFSGAAHLVFKYALPAADGDKVT